MEQDKRSDTHSIINIESINSDTLGLDELFTSKFDYSIKRDMYKPHKNTLAIYDFIRKIMAEDDKIKKPIIIFSPDSAISGATIAGCAEKYMYVTSKQDSDAPVYKTELKVIYIGASPCVSINKYEKYDDYSKSIISDNMGMTEESFSLHRVNLDSDNIFILGYNEDLVNDEDTTFINANKLGAFSFQSIKKKGLNKIMNYITGKCKDSNIHMVIDLEVLSKEYAPSVYRNLTDSKDCKDYGFNTDEIVYIINTIKESCKINSMDITGYNFGERKMREEHYISNTLTIKSIESILSSIINIKKKVINVFDEDSKFLIWKPLNDDDIGWFIFRGLTLEERNKRIQEITDDDTIIIDKINVSDELQEVYITVTSIREQQEKTYYMSNSLYDCCLYPGEKLNMMFELLNTPRVQDNLQDITQDPSKYYINEEYSKYYIDQDEDEDNLDKIINEEIEKISGF